MAAVVGFAFWGLAVTPVGKRVFLLVVAAIPQRHALHDDNSHHGSKSGQRPFKKSAVGGKKTAVCVIPTIYMTPVDRNKVISFCTGVSRTFFTANGGFLLFVAFQPASRQARMGVLGNIRELALEILSDTHGRIGQSPEKAQIFL